MEALSIEEKAKAYDEAKARMSRAWNDNRCTLGFMNEIFPELKESENWIPKEIIKYLKEKGDFRSCWIAWLEKQGNLMKALQISNAKIGELIEKNYYLKEQLEKQGNNMGISEATKQKLEDNLNKALEKETPESCNDFLEKQGKQKPTVEMKTPEESLGIDSDTYNKIVDECIYGEQKPALSEEDERIIEEIINDIECARAINYHIPKEDYEFRENWLKSIKDRVQPQADWKPSEEQLKAIKWVMDGDSPENWTVTLANLYNDLKKLREE